MATQTGSIDLKAAKNAHDEASKKATNYLSADNSGIMVYDGSNGAQTPSNPNSDTRNVFIDSDSVDIRLGSDVLATFGPRTVIGQENGANLVLNTNELYGVTDQNVESFKISGDGGSSTVTISKTVTGHLTGTASKSITIPDKINAELSSGSTYTYRIKIITRGAADDKLAVFNGSFTYGTAESRSSTWTRTGVKYTLSITTSTGSTLSIKVTPTRPSGVTTSYEMTFMCQKEVLTPCYTFGTRKSGDIGGYSFSSGVNNIASGHASFAEGNLNIASGEYSQAGGSGATASGSCSHAEGVSTTASGNYSHAEGGVTTASGNYSHAEGYYSKATELYAHAEGYQTTASRYGSHAEGIGSTASGSYSHAEGQNTTASDSTAHSEGRETTASGPESHAEGFVTVAAGAYSHAGGKYTNANGEAQTVIGKYNVADTTSAFIIGKGTSDSARSNALTVDWSGNVDIASGASYKVNGTSLIDIFYPVGSYYETSDTSFDPNTAWGGTWVQELAGQVHVSSGTGYAVSGALTNASDGGNPDAIVVHHTHTIKRTTDVGVAAHGITQPAFTIPNHTHTWKGWNGLKSASSGTTKEVRSRSAISSDPADTATTSSGGGGACTRTTNVALTNNHSITQPVFAAEATGTSGAEVGANMQPYIVVNRWHRTA